MTISPRRAVSTILAAALLLGSFPGQAQAQVARVVAGETGGMPVSPVSGFAAGTTPAPAFVLGSASLTGSFFAPSIAPSPALVASPFSAAAVQPAVVNAAALTVSARAAASEDAPKLPEAPKASAPVEKKTWRQRIAAAFGRKPTPATAPDAPVSEAAKNGADVNFDGAAGKKDGVDAPSVTGGDASVRSSGLKNAPGGQKAAIGKRHLHIDEFGGPLTVPMNFKQRVVYGLKQGLHLVGIGAILNVTLRPFLNLFPWPQYLSDSALRGFGRVALLTKYGPDEIIAGVANSPATFMGVSLPLAVTMEEITYRLLGFGLTFLLLAAIRPFTRWISTMIGGLPNAAGAVGGATRLLKLGDVVSRFAFPVAALLSSFNFAVAHFATWGFSPFIFALNFSLGLFLAYTAYKSRGLTAPIVAHLVFNLVVAVGLLLALTSPLTGAAFAIIAGLVGACSLLYSWLTLRKERAYRLKHGALVALLLVGAGLSTWHGGLQNTSNGAPRTEQAQMVKKTETAPAPLITAPIISDTTKTDTTAIETRADMIARVKPSVVNVIVYMQGGYATGSGFILTKNGVFITNGHVVGTRQPGEFVNARVPGIDKELRAKVLAVNHDKDLAIVQLEPRPDGKPWPTVNLSQTAPREGEDVTATGYPRGLPFTVTAGVVSGMDGRGNMYVKHLQTDAAINPGNSGGPLFNAKGEVVGVNTQIYTESGGSEGLGFSIMAPEVGRVMAQFAKTGNIATASLGIISNLSDPQKSEAGLEIEYVRYGSAAEKAGLRRGDLVISVGGEAINEGGMEAAGHVASVLSKLTPGAKIKVWVLRGDEPLEFELTVDAKTTSAPSH